MPSEVWGSDDVWQKIRQRVAEAASLRVKVGVLASKGGNALHDPESQLTLIQIAAIHEFGSPAANIPERSFIRLTFAALDDEVQEALRRLAVAVVTKGMPMEKALAIFGAWAVAKVQGTIQGTNDFAPLWDPLKPATVARKGSDAPLIDTGRLLQAIQYEVNSGEDEG